MNKILKSVLYLAVTLLLLSGCSKNGSSAPSEITVSGGETSSDTSAMPFPANACGVRLEKAVGKAVSLSPAATEIICELGYKDVLVGISDYCDYPTDITARKVGSAENPDIDGIIELAPDAVFTLSPLSERETYSLEQAGIAVLTANSPKNLEEYSALYKEIATAFVGRETTGDEKGTEKAVSIGADARSKLEKSAKDISVGGFIYVTGKLTLAGKNTFESAVLSLAGENLCTGEGYVSADQTSAVPDVIIADNALSEEDLLNDETLANYIYNGAEVKYVQSSAFERPTGRTASVFSELI